MRDGSDTRERIEAAALELFVEHGVDATSIRDIARRAKVAEGALYRHHASKDELVWSLFHRHYTAFAAVVDELQRAEHGIDRKVAAMVAGFCRLFDEDSTLFSFLLLVQHGQLAKVPAEAKTPITVIRAVIANALSRGEIPPGDPDLLTAMVVGIVLQTATFAVYGRITQPLGAHAAALSAACSAILTRSQSAPSGTPH
jgi:AcrR family transcriptional regulator